MEEKSTEYLPFESIIPDNIFIFEKEIPNFEKQEWEILRRVVMIDSNDRDMCYKYCGFNKFSVEKNLLPSKLDGWEIYNDIRRTYFIREVFNPNATILVPGENVNHEGYTKYETHDNNYIGFIVFIDTNNNHVIIYGKDDNKIIIDNTDYQFLFTKKIAEYNFISIFIGESPQNKMTEYSGGYGDEFKGNSFLLCLDINKYVHVGSEVFEFVTDNPIIKYVSSVGNNDVPYPYAETSTHCYSMGCQNRTLTQNVPDREIEGHIDYIKNIEYEDFDHIKLASRSHPVYEFSPLENTDWVRIMDMAP